MKSAPLIEILHILKSGLNRGSGRPRSLPLGKTSISREISPKNKDFLALNRLNVQKSLKHTGRGLFGCVKSVNKVSARVQVDRDCYFEGKQVFLVKLATN